MGKRPVNREVWDVLRKRVAELTRGHSEAEDFLHSAYLKLERYQEKNDVRQPPALLLKAALNLSIDHYRRGKRRDDAPLDAVMEVADETPLQDEVVEARVRLARVREGIEKLPERTREIFILYRLRGLRYNEIGEIVGISESAVEKHVAKAMIFLRNWTKDY
jgi:RNA polymerase sigma-70 factor (ECF subfamily)